jgi:hypothetical protein
VIARKKSPLPIRSSDVNKETVHVPRQNRSIRNLRYLLISGCALAALLVFAAPAFAFPGFELSLQRETSERQMVRAIGTGGQFRLDFGSGGPGASETADIKVGASAAEVQSALNALTNVSAGGGSVSVQSFQGGLYQVFFNGGPLANSDVPQLTSSPGSSPMLGGYPKPAIWTVYEAGLDRGDERALYSVTVKNTGNEPTAGTVSFEMSMPAGEKSSLYLGPSNFGVTGGTGWSCSGQPPSGGQPAKALCTRSDPLPAGASYPTLTIVAAIGEDAPDHVVLGATVSGGGSAGPATASDTFDLGPRRVFALNGLDSEVIDPNGNDYTQAGGHPLSGTVRFRANSYMTKFGTHQQVELPKAVIADLPRGFVGNALSVPELCPTIDEVLNSTCPPSSAVGEISVDVNFSGDPTAINMVIYAIKPEFGTPAQFAFAEPANIGTPFVLTPRLRADEGYAISLEATPAPTATSLRGVNNATLCSFGAVVTGPNQFGGCKRAAALGSNPVPLITNPTRCTGQPPTVKVNTDSWEHPGVFVSAETTDPNPTGCQKVDFQPEVKLEPTSHQADSPTGLNVEFTMPTAGLESPTGLSQANLDNATVTFPRGMTVNSAASGGLGACTPAQIKLGSNAPAECPDSSQIGTVEIDTPLIQETLTGHAYLASQKNNPFNSTIGLYLVFSSKKDGVTIKVAGKLAPDPVTGQLTSSFVENPEAPFSRLVLHFNSGPRAPLISPPKCGSYPIHSELSPWSAASPANPTPEEVVSQDSTYEVTSGPNGGACPTGALRPSFEAGLQNASAGSKSPFVLRLSREDGTQRFTALDVSMPPGLTAYLKGVPYCSDHILAGISEAEETGRPELAKSACPSASQIGTVEAGAGAGPFPFYAPGRVFLAGPYKGAPLSIAIVTPAVAGPFDLGNVVVRNGLYIDPVTSQVTVKSDPIPTMLHGILLTVKDIRVNIDRPNFTAAPTNCSAKAIDATIDGEGGSFTTATNRFQVGDCAALGFEPKLGLRLFGGTKRGAHPRLVATLNARPGDANIAGASVALPHSEFLDQAHIRTVCTRVQFAARACPDAAIYGHAEAVTPLLDAPLSGPVYLRSSDNPLPDLVAALRGPDSQPIEVVLDGRVDSVHGGIRNTFEAVPDQPVSSFTLNMQGGKKGLLVNSRDICKSVNKATAKFTAQNGKAITMRPVLANSCKKAAKKHKRHH